MHYNVQSIKHELKTLFVEFKDFDILSFSESWLDDSTPDSELSFEGFLDPERKDRQGDSHGGVLLNVKTQYRYCRRHDIEIQGVESIWVEIMSKTKRFLFGTYYRPPNTLAPQHSLTDDSINMAVNTVVLNVVITGDFNINNVLLP